MKLCRWAVIAVILFSIGETGFVLAGNVPSRPTETFAVLDILSVKKTDEKVTDTVAEAMRSAIALAEDHRVVDHTTMNQRLSGKKCTLAPYSPECFVEQGRLLGVDGIVTGSLVSLDAMYYLSFQMIDARTGKVLNIAETECTPEDLVDAAKKVGRRLANGRFFFLDPGAVPHWGNAAEVSEFARATLDVPERDAWQQPQKVVDHLPVKPGYAVAEIGPGNGYFTPFLSRKAGEGGVIYAVDIDPAMLDSLRGKIEKEGLSNVKPILAEAGKPVPLPKASIDLAFLCEVYFAISHSPDREGFLKQLRDSVKGGGKVVVVDYQKPPLAFVPVAAIDFGPIVVNPADPKSWDDIAQMLTISHYKNATGNGGIAYRFRVPREQVVEEFSKAGFRLEREERFLPYQYFLVFSLN